MYILIILLLILLNGILSMSEIALISARRSSLTTDAKKGDKRAGRALDLTAQPDKFLSTIQIGITLIGILTGLFSGAQIAGDLAVVLTKIGISEAHAPAIAQTAIVVIVTYLTLVLGELLPKRIGQSSAEKIAKRVAGPMQVVAAIGTPFVWLLSKSTSGLMKLFGIKGSASKVTEEEIKSMIQEGTEGGEVREVEQDIVERVFSLGDRKVGSIMTHRSDIEWLDIDISEADLRETVKKHPHTIYPVADDNIDNIKGVVFMKDLCGHIGQDNFKLTDILTPASFFPENMEVYNALEQMRERYLSYSIVTDEFGSVQGMVTLRDILEALVGSMPEESEEPEITERVDGGWIVDGQMSFYDFLTYFGMEDRYPGNEYNTVSGLLFDLFGRIPRVGEKIEWKDFTFEVTDLDGARIDKVLVEKHGEAQ